ncbi:DUF413 domain-containing protein [Glaciecola sp. MH2013]|uniref:DUF413 domain-containing protein n=1 Tax=Glaciecola sp. MH2013 TaxID=2785524 RepID=UPI00189F01AB|nr:DUF413 domain-containing protein [Glaciecola sp. MH2013]MBF7075036.1 DUF413 domain-containing protein [Glaciecola sp. MH2013]
MISTNIRVGSKAFRDDKRFPYGFAKSGDFSIAEANALSTFGATLAGLEDGSLLPETDEERHFVSVVNGFEEVSNGIEKAWMKYIRLARQRRNFFSVHSTAASALLDGDDDYAQDDDSLAP